MSAVLTNTTDTQEKLRILSRDSQYDLACACGSSSADRRSRSEDDRWIYPVTLPEGGRGFLFKTLLSNGCMNDCGYCPLRADTDTRRCSLTPQEVVKAFMSYYRSKRVFGLFISSGVVGSADSTMARLNAIAEILRHREGFKGYLHIKIIPGASDAAIEQTLSLASMVSINLETAGEKHFGALCKSKDYLGDIVRPLKLISALTAPGARYSRVGQSTQFVVGAAGESDRELVRYMGGLYGRMGMSRIYFSAYQRGLGRQDVPGERTTMSNKELLMREHRLYQVDFLLRQYGFSSEEIAFGGGDNLSLECDPKEAWARAHPERFPLALNRASREELLRVPGLGPVSVGRILKIRASGGRLRRLEDVGRPTRTLLKAQRYVAF
jgi:predicted DNA-binding helix-hairpin-helix protein